MISSQPFFLYRGMLVKNVLKKGTPMGPHIIRIVIGIGCSPRDLIEVGQKCAKVEILKATMFNKARSWAPYLFFFLQQKSGHDH